MTYRLLMWTGGSETLLEENTDSWIKDNESILKWRGTYTTEQAHKIFFRLFNDAFSVAQTI